MHLFFFDRYNHMEVELFVQCLTAAEWWRDLNLVSWSILPILNHELYCFSVLQFSHDLHEWVGIDYT